MAEGSGARRLSRNVSIVRRRVRIESPCSSPSLSRVGSQLSLDTSSPSSPTESEGATPLGGSPPSRPRTLAINSLSPLNENEITLSSELCISLLCYPASIVANPPPGYIKTQSFPSHQQIYPTFSIGFILKC